MTTPSKHGISDRVTDKEKIPEVSPMRVVNPNAGPACEVAFGSKLVSEYDGNEEYPEDDPVVKVVFEDYLDNRVPDWKNRLGDQFDEELAAYESEWGVSVRTYYYPQSRLKEIPEEAT